MEEIIVELDSLNEKIQLIDNNIRFNMTNFIGFLTLFLAISGWALNLFAKSIVENRMKEKTKEIKNELKKQLNLELQERIKVYDLEILNGGVLHLTYDNHVRGQPSVFLQSENKDKFYEVSINHNEIEIRDEVIKVYPKDAKIPKHKIKVLVIYSIKSV